MLAVVVIAIILIINILLWWLLLPRLVERKISRFQNDLVNRYYDEIEVMYRKMRGWRHDYHNHIQVLKANMSLGEYGQAADYLDKLEQDLTEVDQSVLFGNLMDNAMEACLEIPEEKERFIRVYIDIVKKQLYISVTNSMKGRAVRAGEGFLSRKQGNHGFGLFRIDSIVAKYHGYLNRQSENGVFATEVMLPLVLEKGES